MAEPLVEFSASQGIGRIVLNRPDAGNAFGIPMALELLDIAARCHDDDAIRCVVLTGRGKLFCAGGDVAAMAGAAAGAAGATGAYLDELLGSYHAALSKLMRMEKPLITLVNGPAAGAGLGLAILGDAVLAGRSASFLAAYGGVGLTPDGATSWLLPRLVGMRQAQRIAVLGEKIGAAEAERIGLVSRVVEDEALEAEGMALAARLAAGPRRALGGARALLLASYEATFEHHLALEARRMAEAGDSAEAAEGIAAFAQRRKPAFQNI